MTEGIDWSAVSDAYGPATDVPDLLASAENGSADEEDWQDLWSRLCHQGSVYAASFAAIPALARIARTTPVTAYSAPLNLLGAICGATDIRGGANDTRAEYADVLASCLPAAAEYAASAQDDTDFGYALAVLSGLQRQTAWHHVLTVGSYGEVSAGCPSCEQDLCLRLDEAPPVAAETWDGPTPGAVIIPAAAAELGGHAAQLYAVAQRHGRDRVAARLLLIVGDTHCPRCGAEVCLRHALGLGEPEDGPATTTRSRR